MFLSSNALSFTHNTMYLVYSEQGNASDGWAYSLGINSMFRARYVMPVDSDTPGICHENDEYLVTHSAHRSVMKIALYPLVRILALSYAAFLGMSSKPELAVASVGILKSM